MGDKLDALDERSTELLVGFFARYGEMVRYHCATRARALVVASALTAAPAATTSGGPAVPPLGYDEPLHEVWREVS